MCTNQGISPLREFYMKKKVLGEPNFEWCFKIGGQTLITITLLTKKMVKNPVYKDYSMCV